MNMIANHYSLRTAKKTGLDSLAIWATPKDWRRGGLKRRNFMFFVFLAAVLWLVQAGNVLGADGDQVLHVTASASDSPNKVTLRWDPTQDRFGGSFTGYEVSRRPLGTLPFTLIATIPTVSTLTYEDTTVIPGVLYEYYLIAAYAYTGSTTITKIWGWAASGVRVNLADAPGTVLILVDDTLASALSRRLDGFQRSLIGAGWKTVRTQVARDTSPVGSVVSSDPRPTKQVITDTLAAHPDLKAVILVGRITIPFSGHDSPDGHGNRAHSTDAYYADINETWTDTMNFLADKTPRNVPGDLRWDRRRLDNGRELIVGRIDFAGMTKFSETEVQLTDRYLNKVHAFRHGWINAGRRGFWTNNRERLIDVTIGNMSSYFGLANVEAKTSAGWASVTANTSYLWAAAGAAGSAEGTTGISTDSMAVSDYKVVFATFGCSYMMETWRNNSAVRAFLAMPTWSIACVNSHRYYGEIIHPTFAMGRLYGESSLGPLARLAKVFDSNVFRAPQGTALPDKYFNLHGDPTVTMYYTPPATNLSVTQSGGNAQLTWGASSAAELAGYHVYRSTGWGAPFTRLTTIPVAGTGYTDTTPRSTDVLYMVRAINLETRGTGTYFAASQGIFTSLTLAGAGNTRPTATPLSQTVAEDNTVSLNLGGTDTENDPLEVVIVRNPSNGKLYGVGGNLTYKPNTNFIGADSFDFVVNDGFQDSAPATGNFTVSTVNDIPVLGNFTMTAVTYRGVATTRALNGTDQENSPLTYRVVTPPTRGLATISGNVLSFTPQPGYTGNDTFTVVANDGSADSLPATVSVTITTDLGLTNSSLKAWWKFDDAAGSTTAADSNPSATKYPATLTGTPGSNATLDTTAGLLGGAVRTTGPKQVTEVRSAMYTGAVANGAASVWFKASDPANNARYQVIMCMGSASNGGWNIYLRNGVLNAHFRTDGTTNIFDTVKMSGIVAGTWNHVVVSYGFPNDDIRRPDQIIVYLNGVRQGALSGRRFYRLTSPHGIGNQPQTPSTVRAMYDGVTPSTLHDSWFNGWIDDVRHYSTTLSSVQVQALYDLGVPPAANQPPVAVASGTLTPDTTPQEVVWSAAGSSDPDGLIYSYAWSFSDGGTAKGPTVTRTYSGTGAFSATLTVTDNQGATATATAQINIAAPTTSGGVPIPWLIAKFGTSPDYEALAKTDHDGDGQNAETEYKAGTDPLNAADWFRITGMTVNPDNSITLQWRGSSMHGVNTPFRVMGNTNLTAPWQIKASSVPRDPSGTTTWSDFTVPAGTNYFYRIEVP